MCDQNKLRLLDKPRPLTFVKEKTANKTPIDAGKVKYLMGATSSPPNESHTYIYLATDTSKNMGTRAVTEVCTHNSLPIHALP